MTPSTVRLVCGCACISPLLGALSAQQPSPLYAPTVILDADSAPFQRLLDFDSDGDFDAVGTRVFPDASKYELWVWRNDGGRMVKVSSQSVSRRAFNPKPGVMKVETGDWNLDGNQDFVVGLGDVVDLYVSQGTGQFQRQELKLQSLASAWAIDVAFVDVDGDAFDDVVILEYPQIPVLGGPRLTVHRAAGGTVSAGISPNVAGKLSVLEADGDPEREVAVYKNENYQPFRLENGVWNAMPVLTTTIQPVWTMPYLWLSGDLDGDKDDDVIVFQPALARNYQPLYQVFRRTGSTSFVSEPELVGGPAEYLVDIDLDGDLDGVCCGGGSGSNTPRFYPKLNFASKFEITRNDGTGRFPVSDAFPGSGSVSLAGVKDMDGDGDVEFVAGRCIFWGHGPWLDHPMPPSGANMYVLRRRLISDGDRDGDIDVMFNPYGGSHNLGDGSFALTRSNGVPAPANRSFAGGFNVDYDGDGAVDSVMPMFERQPFGPQVFEYMVLIHNNGGGTYHFAGPVGPKGLRAGTVYTIDHFDHGDLDADGDVDLVENSNPTRDGYRCRIFWQVSGRIVGGPRFAKRYEGTADFDLDGIPDLLLSTYMRLAIARGTGNASAPFGAPVDLGVGAEFQPNALLIADVDDDGRSDLVVPTSPYPILLLNKVSGFVQSELTGIELADAPFVSSGDFNADGATDLVLGPLEGEPNVSAVLMRRSSVVPAQLSLTDYHLVRQVIPGGFSADVDGDGDVDLVGSHSVRNTTMWGGAAGSRIQVGAGVAGEGGSIPVLGVQGPLRVGLPTEIVLRGVPGPTTAFFGVSVGSASIQDFPVPGLTFRLDPASLVVVPLLITENGQGRAAASLTVPLTIPAILGGQTIHMQAVVLDSAAQHGATCSNALIGSIGL